MGGHNPQCLKVSQSEASLFTLFSGVNIYHPRAIKSNPLESIDSGSALNTMWCRASPE